jgi:hypothetical protein
MIKEFGLEIRDWPKTDATKFRRETRYITSLFERNFDSKALKEKCRKILVSVVNVVTDLEVRDLLGVLTVQVEADIPAFFVADERGKAELTLQYLMSGIRRVAVIKKWDITVFVVAEERVRACGFVNQWVWKKSVPNKAKTLTAEVVVDHQMSQAVISIRFRDCKSKKILIVKPIISDTPSEFIFFHHLGQLSWVDENIVELVPKEGKAVRADCKVA